MWFKNLKIYRLSAHWADRIEQLADALNSERFEPSHGLSAMAAGWVAPREDDDRLVVDVADQRLIALRLEKKLLPATVINQTVKARAVLLEAEQGWRPGRKQLRDLKEAVTDELMPRAFSIARDTRVWLDPSHHWLVIDAAAASQADEVLSALGRAVHPFPVEPLRLTQSITGLMTDWMLRSQAPEGFSLEDDSQWQSAGEAASVIRYARHALGPETIAQHVASGYHCTRLSLTWQDRVSFVLTENGDLKRLAPLDILQERATEAGALTPEEQLDADFSLMCAEINALLGALMPIFGETREGAS